MLRFFFFLSGSSVCPPSALDAAAASLRRHDRCRQHRPRGLHGRSRAWQRRGGTVGRPRTPAACRLRRLKPASPPPCYDPAGSCRRRSALRSAVCTLDDWRRLSAWCVVRRGGPDVPTTLMGATLPFVVKSALAHGTISGGRRRGSTREHRRGGTGTSSSASDYFSAWHLVVVPNCRAVDLTVAPARSILSRRTDGWRAGPDSAASPSASIAATASPVPAARAPDVCRLGFVFFGLEMIWFWMLIVLFRPTKYAFTVMLATVLAGCDWQLGVDIFHERASPPRRSACGVEDLVALAWSFDGGRWLRWVDLLVGRPRLHRVAARLCRATGGDKRRGDFSAGPVDGNGVPGGDRDLDEERQRSPRRRADRRHLRRQRGRSGCRTLLTGFFVVGNRQPR